MAGTEHSDLHVTVTLEDVDLREHIPKRTITLRAPDWQVHIGRGTQSGYGGITAAPDNTWFDSKVMSRSHAVLRADPTTKDILIEDVGSMHGTQLCGRRLAIYQLEKVWNNDTVTMGADVVRGSTHFSALRLRATWKWSDESSEPNDPRSPYGNIYRNTFTADYYSDDEAYEELSSEILGDQEGSDYQIYEVDGHLSDPDKEDQVIQGSVREASVEIVIPQARTFTTPDSDNGSTQDSSSLGELSDDETESAMRSKIVTLSPVYSIAPVVTATNPKADDPSQPSASSPADVIQCESNHDNDETSEPDSYADYDFENRHSDPLEANYIPSSQTEAGPSSSMIAPEPEHGRAPSPSDAAMVKASGEATNSASSTAPPFSPYSLYKYSGTSCGFVPPTGHPGPSFAGHNSAFSDPVPRAPSPQQRSQFDSVHHPASATCAPVYTAPFTYQAPEVPPAAHPLSPLSIASLVQQHSEEESRGSRKRKADEICCDTFHPNPAPSEFASSEIGDTTAASLTDGDVASSTVGTTRLSHPALVMGTAEGLCATNMEPLRKKARKTKSRTGEQRGNSFIKMAAATLTGIAIGAVGTIVGLAALPQDYFI